MAEPIFKTKKNKISLAVWQNPKSKSVTLQRSYFDKETQQHKNISSFFDNQIPDLIAALEEAQAFLAQSAPQATEEDNPF